MNNSNTQTAAPGVAVTIENLLTLADNYANSAANVSLDKFVNKVDDAPARAAQLACYAELESTLRTALLAGAAGGDVSLPNQLPAYVEDAIATANGAPPVPVRAPQVTELEVRTALAIFNNPNNETGTQAMRHVLEAFASGRVGTGALPASPFPLPDDRVREQARKLLTELDAYFKSTKQLHVNIAYRCDKLERALAATPPSAAPAAPTSAYICKCGMCCNCNPTSQSNVQLVSPAKPTGEIPAPLPVCPITGRKFWGNLHHPELGTVATYGGPFDTYTVPQIGEDGELRSERYDQDAGCWVEGGEPVGWFYADQQGSGEVQVDAARATLTDKEKHDLLVGQAVERAARDLPEGWELTINLERGAGWVEWTNDEGNTMGIEADGEPFHQQINAAIDAAIASTTPPVKGEAS